MILGNSWAKLSTWMRVRGRLFLFLDPSGTEDPKSGVVAHMLMTENICITFKVDFSVRWCVWLVLGEGTGNPYQYSCLENPLDREAWPATVHRIVQSQTCLERLSTQACTHMMGSKDVTLWGTLPKSMLLPLLIDWEITVKPFKVSGR